MQFYLKLVPVQAYFARIDEVNLKGPSLRAILELNPSALAQATLLDKERKSKGKRSALHGIPILLKVIASSLAANPFSPCFVRITLQRLLLRVS